MTNKTEEFSSSFGVESPNFVTWRLTFNGKHYFADIGSIVNFSHQLSNFLSSIINQEKASLSLDDEGDFFEINAQFNNSEPEIVELKIEEARDGRQTELVITAKQFVEQVLSSIGLFRKYFSNTEFVEGSVLEKSSLQSEFNTLEKVVQMFVKKWGLPKDWGKEYLGIKHYLVDDRLVDVKQS